MKWLRVKELCQQRKRHQSYWSAMSAEVDLGAGLARAYVRDNVKAPPYRLPTIAYDKGFLALLGDGAVSEEKTRSIYGSTHRWCRSIMDWRRC